MLTRPPPAAAIARFLREETGPTATEYAILMALLILVATAAIRTVGGTMAQIYDHINAEIPT